MGGRKRDSSLELSCGHKLRALYKARFGSKVSLYKPGTVKSLPLAALGQWGGRLVLQCGSEPSHMVSARAICTRPVKPGLEQGVRQVQIRLMFPQMNAPRPSQRSSLQ